MTTFVGIDVSAGRLDVHVDAADTHLQFANSKSGIGKLLRQLGTCEDALVVMEATGGYETPAHIALSEAGHAVAVVNPLRIRRYAQALGLIEKDDRIDARVLSRYGKKESPYATPAPTADERELRGLVTRRSQLVAMKTQELNRRQHPSNTLAQSNTTIIAALDLEIREIGHRIEAAMRRSPELATRARRLRSAPGIGKTIAVGLVAQLPELGKLSHAQIAKLVGVAPIVRDSGRYRGQRRVSGGRKEIRSLLYMAVLVHLRHGLWLADYFRRLVQRGKPGAVAITACMRKLLVRLNAMERDGIEWNSSRQITD